MSGWPGKGIPKMPHGAPPEEPLLDPKGETIYMYYETDGDAGYYGIELFFSKEAAERYQKKKNDAYGNVRPILVHGAPLAF